MRDVYIDILKGFGIVAVVITHAQIPIWPHLEIFFFVSGFLLNPKKCMDFGSFFLHKLKTIWKPFVLYNILFFVLHDFFIYIGWMTNDPGADPFIKMIVTCLDAWEIPAQIFYIVFTGTNIDTMCGATWFIAPLLTNLLLFAFLVKISEGRASWVLPALIIFFFALGKGIIDYRFGNPWNADMAMFCLPITAAGFYMKKFCSSHEKLLSEFIYSKRYIGLVGSVISLAIIIHLWKAEIHNHLAGYAIGDWYLYYFVVFISTWVNLFVSQWIMFISWLKKFFAFVGQKSFHIMALHLVGFKLITTIIVLLRHQPLDWMSFYLIPNASLKLKLIYIVAGVCVPLLLNKIYEKVNEPIKLAAKNFLLKITQPS